MMGRKSKKTLLAEALFKAAQLGDEAGLSAALAAGAEIEAHPFSMTALEVAAREGHEGCVRRLLAAGAAVDATPSGWTALSRAAGGGHAGCVEALLDAGADPKNPGPLRLGIGRDAVIKGFDACVRLLLSRGAGPDLGATDGQSALGWAASNGRLECARMLLEAGASPSMRVISDYPEEIAVSVFARASGHPEVGALIDAFFLARQERAELEGHVAAAPSPKAKRPGF
jgi:ankyrin repeat protein